MEGDLNNPCDDKEIRLKSYTEKFKFKQLGDYRNSYNSDESIEDLVKYFDGQVDFNLAKIGQKIEAPQRLPRFIAQAKKNNTHPVVEFVKELFIDIVS
ncbi:MAG: hypothetical protein ABIE75_03035 [Candidatus Omnitrophota bacterium]